MVRAAELAARESYGRLLAILARRSRDIAAAEDALAEAFLAALTQWHEAGVPVSPDAWLLTAARRKLIDRKRREQVRDREQAALMRHFEELELDDTQELPDHRLHMLFVCTHPAIEAAAQVPLMLQTVLGLRATDIASAVRVAPKTMGQRLSRAKLKIRAAGIPFEIPPQAAWPERLEGVLEAIYAAFGLAWEDVDGIESRFQGLNEEAILLGRTLLNNIPEEPEAMGLLALMLYADARRPARRSTSGEYTPLEAQNTADWDAAKIREAEALLVRASRFRAIGPYQLEAAIQSAHIQAARSGRIDSEPLLQLYDGLVSVSPTLGAQVARAAALLEYRGAEAALTALDAVPQELARGYQPWWAIRAAALRSAERIDEARGAYAQAMGMTEDEAVRRFLYLQARALGE